MKAPAPSLPWYELILVLFNLDMFLETKRSLVNGAPTRGYQFLKSSEYLLESLPQALLQGYMLLHLSLRDP